MLVLCTLVYACLCLCLCEYVLCACLCLCKYVFMCFSHAYMNVNKKNYICMYVFMRVCVITYMPVCMHVCVYPLCKYVLCGLRGTQKVRD